MIHLYLKYRIGETLLFLKRLHNYPMISVCIGILLGTIFFNMIVLLTALLFLLFPISKRLTLLLIIGIAIGSVHFFWWQNRLSQERLPTGEFQTHGTIIEPPNIRGFSASLIVDLDEYKGHAQLQTFSSQTLVLGDRVSIIATSSPVFEEDFEQYYIDYLVSKQVWYTGTANEIIILDTAPSLTSVMGSTREYLIESIKDVVPQESGTLTAGIVLGANEDFEKETEEAMRMTGTTHVVSASGFNALLVFTIITSIAEMIRKRYAIILGLLGSVLYVLIIGVFIIPAVRAVIMLLLLKGGLLFGRKMHVLNALVIASTVLILLYPFNIFNVSFLLSTFSTGGLFLFSEKIENFLQDFKTPGLIRAPLAVTIAAMISVFPISFLVFGELSLISPVANLLIAPLVPIIMYAGILGIGSELLHIQIFTRALELVLNSAGNLFLSIVNFLATLPSSSSSNVLVMIVVGLVGLLVIVFYDKKYVIKKTT